MTYIEGTSHEWYNTKRLERFAADCPLWMVNGARGVGKTVFALRRCAENWAEGKQTVYCRLFQRHIRDPEFWGRFLSSGRRLGFIPGDWTCDARGVHIKGSDEMPVIFLDLNTAYSAQGPEYDKVKDIIVDEYTVRPGELYPRGVVSKLHSLIGTVARGRDDVRCMMFSNWTSASNPFWATLGIYPSDKWDVSVWHDKGAAIEICRRHYYNQDMPGEDSPMGRLLGSLHGPLMESAAEDPNYSLVAPRPSGVHPTHLVLEDPEGRRWRQWTGPGMQWWGPAGPEEAGDWNCVDDVRRVGGGRVLVPAESLSRVRKEIESGGTRFQGMQALYSVMSMVYVNYR